MKIGKPLGSERVPRYMAPLSYKLPATKEGVVVIDRDNRSWSVVSPIEAQVLRLCASFRTLKGHADAITSAGALDASRDEVSRALERLARRRLLIEVSELSDRFVKADRADGPRAQDRIRQAALSLPESPQTETTRTSSRSGGTQDAFSDTGIGRYGVRFATGVLPPFDAGTASVRAPSQSPLILLDGLTPRKLAGMGVAEAVHFDRDCSTNDVYIPPALLPYFLRPDARVTLDVIGSQIDQAHLGSHLSGIWSDADLLTASRVASSDHVQPVRSGKTILLVNEGSLGGRTFVASGEHVMAPVCAEVDVHTPAYWRLRRALYPGSLSACLSPGEDVYDLIASNGHLWKHLAQNLEVSSVDYIVLLVRHREFVGSDFASVVRRLESLGHELAALSEATVSEFSITLRAPLVRRLLAHLQAVEQAAGRSAGATGHVRDSLERRAELLNRVLSEQLWPTEDGLLVPKRAGHWLKRLQTVTSRYGRACLDAAQSSEYNTEKWSSD